MLQLGLINCDPLSPQVIKRYGDYPSMFSNLLSLATNQVTWRVFDATHEKLPKKLHDCDAYLISGSQFGVLDNYQWIKSLTHFIKTLWQEKIKTIGICFGHQAIAHVMGGQVDRAPNGWRLGVAKTIMTNQQDWMTPWQKNFHVCVSHQDQVLTLPPKSIRLAKTNLCPNAMIQMGNIFLSFQGHPEFNQNYTRFLIEKRKALFPSSTYNKFINSLSLDTNMDLLSKWIVNFIVQT